ncbi:Transketolase-like protein 1 [Tupaia chinensis]|uniref:transketolase n=1 Tax=Tupaia chinensis TaxID=246437 RepID=L8YAJ8_TUPCH|nr:Transketolase-like protein 1 [Tupaia chinensis]
MTCVMSAFSHPTACSSSAEIMSVLFFYTMRYKQLEPENPDNDRFVVSKRLSIVDVATGWLGQGLGVACGMAYTGKYFDTASYRVFCLLGDSESLEGSVWEALAFASHYSLDNLVAIFDVNRLGHGGSLPPEHSIDICQKRCEAFGWNTYVVDGRDVEVLCQVFWQAAQVKKKPTAVIAKTFKGRGVPSKPAFPFLPAVVTDARLQDVATRKACGLALARLGHINDRVVVLDGDTKNSTFSEIFKKEHPERFIECFIAEQNMVSVALGCATHGRTIAFASTFAAFLTRAFDQIRMGTMSQANINLVGSHCGVSVGEDGPSQMALEDLAMFRAVPHCTIFYPSDAVSTEHAVFLAADTKVIRQSASDKVTVIGAGITLPEALAAADDLSKQDISIRVIDPFTVKPLDAATIIASAKATGGRIITVEDHYPEGGIGEAVCAAVSMEPDILVHQLAVSGVPRSGQPSELLDVFGISARHIVVAVKCILMN